jgi:hypothetical protein
MNNVLDYKGYRFFQSHLTQMKRNYIICKPRFLNSQLHTLVILCCFAMMSIMFTKHLALLI